MRKLAVVIGSHQPRKVHRVVDYESFAAQWEPSLRFLVKISDLEEQMRVEELQAAGLDNVSWVYGAELELGDIVVPHEGGAQVQILLRASDSHHALFMTNRCNSYCLMCSQPPTAADDSWLIDESLDAIAHMGWTPQALGLTGGEPLLLRSGLRRILDALGAKFPDTTVEILTNGRLFAEPELVDVILSGLSTRVRWLVPLYGHANFMHDYVVQAPGAFDETIAGLLALQEHQQQIQLRTVLIEPVLEILPQLSDFVGRNLPFVQEWALMGCEPIGFALANRQLCEVNLSDWSSTLEQASRVLRRHRLPHLFMNTPLCALPRTLWPLAHRSISDWKNVYADECERCVVRQSCVGLFAWHERGWTPAPLRAIKITEASP